MTIATDMPIAAYIDVASHRGFNRVRPIVKRMASKHTTAESKHTTAEFKFDGDMISFNMLRRTLLAGTLPSKALHTRVIDQNKTTEYILVHCLSCLPIRGDAEGTYRLNVKNDTIYPRIITTKDIDGSDKLFDSEKYIMTLSFGEKVNAELTVVDGVGHYMAGGNAKYRRCTGVSFREDGGGIIATVSTNGGADPTALVRSCVARLRADLKNVVDAAEGKQSTIAALKIDDKSFALSINLVDKRTIPMALFQSLVAKHDAVKITDEAYLKPWLAIVCPCETAKKCLDEAFAEVSARIDSIESAVR
jgi:hypothetical protein